MSMEPGADDTVTVIRQMAVGIADLRGDVKGLIKTGKETKDHLATINGNIDAIERWRWMITGGLTVVVFLVGVFGSVVLAKALP